MSIGEVILGKDEYFIRISYGTHFKNTLENVKSLPGRRWDPSAGCWVVKVNDFTTNKLKEMGFVIPYQLTATKDRLPSLFKSGETFGLRKYQRRGVDKVEEFGGRALIADEMGLGKTAQSLVYLRLHPELRPALIICPASLKLNWEREVKQWCPDEKRVYVIDGTWDVLPAKGITIINYEMLKRFSAQKTTESGKVEYIVKQFKKIGYKAVIFDEVHAIMNKGRQRTEISLKIAKDIPTVIGLSGTPIMSRPIEIFNFINLLKPDIFDSRWRFAERFCDLSNNGYGWDFNGCNKDRTAELHKLLTSTVMIRRLKSEVLTELPPRQISVIPFEIDNNRDYLAAEAEVVDELSETSQGFMAQCDHLKTVAMNGKYPKVVGWIKSTLEETGEKLVVMAHHLDVISRLCEEFKGVCVRFTGQESLKEKQAAVDSFQTDPKVRLFIGGLKAAGVGITLTAASKLAIIELLWTPGIHDQAGDRIHRIGQTQPVNIYYLMANNTVEMELAEMLDKKRKDVSGVLDGKEASEDTLLVELYNRYKKRRKRRCV